MNTIDIIIVIMYLCTIVAVGLLVQKKASRNIDSFFLGNRKLPWWVLGASGMASNTDIAGFELAIKYSKYDLTNKEILILGAGGVVSSIIFALKKMRASKIIISNRTKKKAEDLKIYFKDLEIVDWGEITDFDMIINATSIGLKINDEIELDYEKIGPNKFFFDIIYNPTQTNFLKKAKKVGNRIENGKMMFIYQAHQAFTLWHKIMPKIDDETISLLD